MASADAIVQHMMQLDAFSHWLGIEVLDVGPGHATLRMVVRPEMCNGFGIAHGGIAYSLADSALAFAANGHGRVAVSARTSIAHLLQVQPGMSLTAKAREVHAGNRLAHYQIDIINSDEATVATFEGVVYLTSKKWENI